jgi:hypothetical protein
MLDDLEDVTVEYELAYESMMEIIVKIKKFGPPGS